MDGLLYCQKDGWVNIAELFHYLQDSQGHLQVDGRSLPDGRQQQHPDHPYPRTINQYQLKVQINPQVQSQFQVKTQVNIKIRFKGVQAFLFWGDTIFLGELKWRAKCGANFFYPSTKFLHQG